MWQSKLNTFEVQDRSASLLLSEPGWPELAISGRRYAIYNVAVECSLICTKHPQVCRLVLLSTRLSIENAMLQFYTHAGRNVSKRH